MGLFLFAEMVVVLFLLFGMSSCDVCSDSESCEASGSFCCNYYTQAECSGEFVVVDSQSLCAFGCVGNNCIVSECENGAFTTHASGWYCCGNDRMVLVQNSHVMDSYECELGCSSDRSQCIPSSVSCFEISADAKHLVCNANGNCFEQDVCTCFDGFDGISCGIISSGDDGDLKKDGRKTIADGTIPMTTGVIFGAVGIFGVKTLVDRYRAQEKEEDEVDMIPSK